jgi:membrane protein
MRCVGRESFTDRTFMVAGGLAFFGMFSLMPAIAVAGLVFQALVPREALEEGVLGEAALFPEAMPALLVEFLTEVPQGLAAGFGLSLNLLIVLYTVQRAASGTITAMNVVFGEDETRSRVRREAVAMALALGAMAVLFLALFLLVVAPLVVRAGGGPEAMLAVRWPVLVLALFGGLVMLYRFAADREFVAWGAIVAGAAAGTVVLAAASWLFTLYMNTAGDWELYYGSITTPVVLMTWLFLSGFVVMAGAELDAQIEAEAYPGSHETGTKAALDRREGIEGGS